MSVMGYWGEIGEVFVVYVVKLTEQPPYGMLLVIREVETSIYGWQHICNEMNQLSSDKHYFFSKLRG